MKLRMRSSSTSPKTKFFDDPGPEETHGKGGFTGMRNSAIELFPLDQPALDAAKQSSEHGVETGSNWPAISSSNPLSGTELKIHSGQ